MTKRNDIEQLFREHYAAMYRQAVALLHDDEPARDIVHDVFAAIMDAGACSVSGAYLLKAVRNRCLNHIRDLDIHRRVVSLYFLENDEYDTEDWPDAETIAAIQKLVSSEISPQARRVMELRFNQGLTFAKVAEAMGISETAVYRHMSHALSIIRQKLNQQ